MIGYMKINERRYVHASTTGSGAMFLRLDDDSNIYEHLATVCFNARVIVGVDRRWGELMRREEDSPQRH